MRLSIKASALRGKLAAMTGLSPVGDLTFEPRPTLRDPELTRLRRLIDHLVLKLGRKEDPIPDLTVAQHEQSLIICLLFANRQNFSHLLGRRQALPAVAQVHRATAFIDANASLPIWDDYRRIFWWGALIRHSKFNVLLGLWRM